MKKKFVAAADQVAANMKLSNGEDMGYSHLIWAAGGDARRLSCSGAELAGVAGIILVLLELADRDGRAEEEEN